MKTVILGASGQLAGDLSRHAPGAARLTPFTRADADVCEHDRLAVLLGHVRPEVVINTTAYHDVEGCERDPSLAFATNAIAVRALARCCDRLDARLVHVSTDYVFDGTADAPYDEQASPRPVNVYGASKLAGELMIDRLGDRHLVVRTSALFGAGGSRVKGGNFVDRMLARARLGETLAVVDDQVLSPTWTADLATVIWQLVERRESGLVHATGEGSCSWYALARHACELAGLSVEVEPVSTVRRPGAARRPLHSALRNGRLDAIGVPTPRPWQEALAAYLASVRVAA